MNESSIYSEADLAPFHRRLNDLRQIVHQDSKQPKALTKLLERQLNECGMPSLSPITSPKCLLISFPSRLDVIVKQMQESLSILSPELVPVHQKLVTIRRQLVALAAKESSQKAELKPLQEELRRIDSLSTSPLLFHVCCLRSMSSLKRSGWLLSSSLNILFSYTSLAYLWSTQQNARRWQISWSWRGRSYFPSNLFISPRRMLWNCAGNQSTRGLQERCVISKAYLRPTQRDTRGVRESCYDASLEFTGNGPMELLFKSPRNRQNESRWQVPRFRRKSPRWAICKSSSDIFFINRELILFCCGRSCCTSSDDAMVKSTDCSRQANQCQRNWCLL